MSRDKHSCLAETLLNCHKVSVVPATCEDLTLGEEGRTLEQKCKCVETHTSSGVMFLGKPLHCNYVCIMFGLQKLLGLVTGFYAIIIYLARPAAFKLRRLFPWGTFDKI